MLYFKISDLTLPGALGLLLAVGYPQDSAQIMLKECDLGPVPP